MMKLSSVVTPKSVSELLLAKTLHSCLWCCVSWCFSYVPVGVMGLWSGKSGLHNNDLSFSLFITPQLTCLPQILSIKFLCHCLSHQWANELWQKSQSCGITAKCGHVHWWPAMINILSSMKEPVFNPHSQLPVSYILLEFLKPNAVL